MMNDLFNISRIIKLYFLAPIMMNFGTSSRVEGASTSRMQSVAGRSTRTNDV